MIKQFRMLYTNQLKYHSLVAQKGQRMRRGILIEVCIGYFSGRENNEVG